MKETNITPHMMVEDLLNQYPQLEKKLIEIAPVFEKLKNPVLRKTVAKVTNLKQASVIGGVPLADLINKLRAAAGLDEIKINNTSHVKTEKPEWVLHGKVITNYDAREDIDSGVHPAAKVTKEIESLNRDEIYILTTPFVPTPLINIIEGKGFETFSEKAGENLFHNYIKTGS